MTKPLAATESAVKVLVVSCSLHAMSRSFVLAREAAAMARRLGADSRLVDLREHELPLCDAAAATRTADVHTLTEAVREADAIILAAPIYNFDVNAAAKNLVEWTGRAWTDKVVGFLVVAGGRSSYMSPMVMANSLMLDFRCLVVPRFVYAVGDDFAADRTPDMTIGSETVRARVDELVRAVVRVAGALATAAE